MKTPKIDDFTFQGGYLYVIILKLQLMHLIWNHLKKIVK